MRRHGGFTLVELLVTVTISAIVVGFVATFIGVPVQSHLAQVRRSELAASTEAVGLAMSRDVSRALPNSVRTGFVNARPAVELIAFSGVVLYRDDTLNTGTPDTAFDTVVAPPVATSHVVVSVAGQDPYAPASVMAPATIDASTTITLNPAFSFPAQSTNRRAFLVAAPSAVIRYECDLAAGTLRRYDGLAVTPLMTPLPAGTPSRLIARDVTACTFTPRPASTEHGGMLLLQVTTSRVTNGATDSLRVMKQIKVEEVA
jgi:MSHA biogenesis protein MshO